MKPNPGSINMKDSPMNSNNCINSLQSIPSLKSSSSMLLGVPKMKTEIYPRHISPFLQRSIDNANNNGNNQNHHTLQQNVNSNITASYFQDDSEIRQVIEEIKRNENFENGMSYLTDYLEKHPGEIKF